MNTPATADVRAHVGPADESSQVGAAMVDALSGAWGADGVVVVLPASGDSDGRAGAVLAVGPLVEGVSSDEIRAVMDSTGLDVWLRRRGAAIAASVPLPQTTAGFIAAGWRRDAHAPTDPARAVAWAAAYASIAIERRGLQARVERAAREQKEAHDQLARTRRVRALGEMASGIVHDFNNCLTSILGLTELALGPLEKTDGSYNELNSIRTAALDAAAVVKRLQSIGRGGRAEADRQVVDLREIVQAMPALARPRWTRLELSTGVAFELVVEAGAVPLVRVVVPEIRELLLNLLFNAVDAMPRGGRITLRTAERDGWAEISVADEEIGMSDEVRREIFKPFYSTKGDGGTGLGLSVCQTIAERHDGRLQVRSTLGVGSVFTLTLPPAPAELAGTKVVLGETLPTEKLPAQDLLLVDDQVEVRESVGDMLRSMGHRVAVASGGREALGQTERQHFDAVITDFGMPEVNGLELAECLESSRPGLPVVVFSGWGLDPDAPRPDNVTRVLSKPVGMHALGEALSACVAHGRASVRSRTCS